MKRFIRPLALIGLPAQSPRCCIPTKVKKCHGPVSVFYKACGPPVVLYLSLKFVDTCLNSEVFAARLVPFVSAIQGTFLKESRYFASN